MRNTIEEQVISDMVTKMLYLGYTNNAAEVELKNVGLNRKKTSLRKGDTKNKIDHESESDSGKFQEESSADEKSQQV